MFQEVNTPSGTLYYSGKVLQRRNASKVLRNFLVSLPTCPQDIKILHDFILQQKFKEQFQPDRTIDFSLYGQIAISAICGNPLIIIGSSRAQIIHFSHIQDIRDEIDLKSSCNFSIVTSHNEYRFKTMTSVEYQQWFKVLQKYYKESVFNNPQTYINPPLSPTSDIRSLLTKTPSELRAMIIPMQNHHHQSMKFPERFPKSHYTQSFPSHAMTPSVSEQSSNYDPGEVKSYAPRNEDILHEDILSEYSDIKPSRGYVDEKPKTKFNWRSKLALFLNGKEKKEQSDSDCSVEWESD